MIAETFKADPGPAVEAQVAGDMARRMLPVLPVLVIVAGLIWGLDGGTGVGGEQRGHSGPSVAAHGLAASCCFILAS